MGRFKTLLTGRVGHDVSTEVPDGFADVAEALRCGDSPRALAGQAGRDLARQGIDLGFVLDSLAATYRQLHVEPDFALAQAVAVEWTEESLRFAHTMSCEDPLTGFDSLPHLKSRLDAVYRWAEADGVSAREFFAVVVIDIGDGASAEPFARSLHQIELRDVINHVYHRDEVVAAVTSTRVGILVRRRDDLAGRCADVRRLVNEWAPTHGIRARVWIEALPTSPESARFLVDELTR